MTFRRSAGKDSEARAAMATKNFFDLLGDDENEDPAQVVVRANSSLAADSKPAAAGGAAKKPAAAAPAAGKLPTKPAPPSEAGTCFFVVTD